MVARKKLAIIDGKSVFYRGYYALPNLSTKEGIPTGGVYGFATMALELIKKLQPDYVCVAWDKPKTNIRARVKIYPEYKAGRQPAPADFYTQIPLLHELLDTFGWPLYELDDYEADDIMGTFAVQAKAKDVETMLITSDLDALQLINSHTHVYALKRGFSNIELFHPESFEKKYGLGAEQFLDLKALKGDSSDNIPGVPGIGEKTATELLKQYKTLDDIYKHLPDIKESTRLKLEKGKELAYLSKKLGAIWTNAPIRLDLKAMDGRNIDTKRLRELLQQLEFRSLLNNLPENMREEDSKLQAQSSKLDLLPGKLIDNDKYLNEIKLNTKEPVFIHSRSAGAHGANPQVLVLGDGKNVYILDLTKLNHKKVKQTLSSQFSAFSLIGYDVKSSLKVLKILGIEAKNVGHDVLVGGYLLNSLERIQSLTELARDQLGYESTPFENMPTEDYIARAPEFMAVIEALYKLQIHEFIEMPKLAKLAETIEWPLTSVLADMELIGIKLDTAYLKKFSHKINNSISDLEQRIYGHANHEFNISSPAQLSDVLFSKLNIPTANIKKTKTGYSTAASELDKLRGLHPIIDLISQYREATKLKNTYIDTLPLMVDENSRLHTTFNLTIAPTGRLSSADPNLQNIPVRTELGRNIRSAFVADKGCLLVSADYSQFEIRLAAALSGDKGMIESFNAGRDIHVETAAAVFDIKPEKVTKEQRYSAKAVNFGIMYGLGPHGLSASSGMPYAESREFINKYFEIRPQLKTYIEKLRKEAEEQGYVETLLGRRRPTPDVRSSNFVVREAAYRAAINHPLQGTAADLMKLAMVEVQKNFDSQKPKAKSQKPKMLLQIHDSLLVECQRDDAKKVGEILKKTMENIYDLPVKLAVDITSGKNWGEL